MRNPEQKDEMETGILIKELSDSFENAKESAESFLKVANQCFLKIINKRLLKATGNYMDSLFQLEKANILNKWYYKRKVKNSKKDFEEIQKEYFEILEKLKE